MRIDSIDIDRVNDLMIDLIYVYEVDRAASTVYLVTGAILLVLILLLAPIPVPLKLAATKPHRMRLDLRRGAIDELRNQRLRRNNIAVNV
eukprot:1203408-Amorphochlora_amoeboformis.AAC.1